MDDGQAKCFLVTVEVDRYSMLLVARNPCIWVYDCATLKEYATAVAAIQELSMSKSNRLSVVRQENIAKLTLRIKDIDVLVCMCVCVGVYVSSYRYR